MTTVPTLHQADIAREKGKLIESLKLYEQAQQEYQQQNNYDKLSEVFQGKFIAFKHLYLKTKDKKYLNRAEQATNTALEMIKQHGQGVEATCHFQLAKLAMFSSQYLTAIKHYTKAYETLENKPEEGRYLYHTGLAFFYNGEKDKGKDKEKDKTKETSKDSGES